MPYGLSRLREREPWLLGPRWVSRAVTYLFFVALGLLMLPVALPVAIAIVVAVAFAALWLLLKTTAERLADARVRAVDTDRRPNSRARSLWWVRTAGWVFPPALAEGFVNDVYHRREQMARQGISQMTIELATAVVYGQAFVGWLFTLVLRLLTVPWLRPKD